MKFGLLASHQYLRTDDLRQRLNELWDLTSRAAGHDFDGVFAIQHFISNLQTPQTISVVAKLLDVSGNMTVGTGILILPAFHPVHVAEEFATLDQMSGGRLVLGVGAGYRRDEFRALGIDKEGRFAQMRESIEVIRKLWSGEPVSYRGNGWELDGDTVGVMPFQRGGPPIWVGAGGFVAIQKAAQIADAWMSPGNAPSEGWYEKAMAAHDTALAAAGKSREGREYPVTVNVFCAATDAKADELVRPYIEAEYFKYAEYPQLSFQREKFDFLWENRFLIGSPDTVAAKVEHLRSLGFNYIVARMHWLGTPHELVQDSMDLYGKEVLPRFR